MASTLTTTVCKPLSSGLPQPGSPPRSPSAETITVTGIFGNQVAGHMAFLKAKNGIVCKPFVYQEWWFYNAIKDHPKYHPWTVQAHGYIQFTQAQLVEWVRALNRQQLEASDSLHKRPWTQEVQDRLERQLQQLQETTPENHVHRYIVLEDLCDDFIHPCTLDVKMGTRMHSDDASEQKIKSQQFKCGKSTSSSMGIRLCGYKTWRPNGNAVHQVNKYVHREMEAHGVPTALYDFFFSGEHLRRDVIVSLIAQLKQLEKDIIKDRSFRIYSSSLLLMYEGDKDAPTRVKVKMVDWAHTYRYEVRTVPNDDGYLFGLSNLIAQLELVLDMAEDD